ncbi:MAG: hypothetical protein D6820_17660, partial [Lentisphaerae bacterium]
LQNYSRRNEGGRRDAFGTHEFYQLCAYLHCDPWANLPGTLLPEDIDAFMEYCGAPSSVGYGKLRASLGQEQPWTQVFRKIHVQFGNEVITFWGTGFWGQGYWEALVQRAKQSPYYDPDVFVFHLNHQGSGTYLLQHHPSFDRFTVNGYHIMALYNDQIQQAGDLAGFYEFVFASAWHMWMDNRHNDVYRYLEAARDHDKEISIYEGGNYHTTSSDDVNPPVDRINRMITSLAGGVSAVNSSLILLKHWGARTQENFNFSQFQFSPGGTFGSLQEKVRLWGGVLRSGNPDEFRFRPRYLALAVANRALMGDLVKTTLSGDSTTFSVTNRFGNGYSESKNPETMTISDIPRIHAYACQSGNKRGLILVSNDPRQTRNVKIVFPGSVKDAHAEITWLQASDIDATNEHDYAPDGPEVTL